MNILEARTANLRSESSVRAPTQTEHHDGPSIERGGEGTGVEAGVEVGVEANHNRDGDEEANKPVYEHRLAELHLHHMYGTKLTESEENELRKHIDGVICYDC